MKWFYVTAVVLVVLLTLSPLHFLESQETGAYAHLTIYYNSYADKIRSLDPATCGDTASSGVVQGPVFESLYDYQYLKRPMELFPNLAEDMPRVSSDLMTYTIKLRPGVVYHRNECFGVDANGTPQTRTVLAEDFVLAFKRIADYHVTTSLSLAFIEDKIAGIKEYRDRTKTYDKGDFSRYDLPLDGVRALDEHTLQIRLTTPFPQLVYVLAILNYAPIPHEVIDYYLTASGRPGNTRTAIPMDRRDPEIRDYRAMVGTGAYYVDNFMDAGDIVLRRNPDFRDFRYPSEGAPGDKVAGLLDDAGKKLPFIDVERVTYVPEDNPAWMLFLTKQTDISGIPRPAYQQVISPSKELTDKWAKKGIRLIKYSSPDVYWLAFNMNDPILGKCRPLRQALCLSFNVEQYIDVLFNGRGIRAVNVVPSSLDGHDQGGPGPYYRFDLDEARKKLQAARTELQAAGLIGPDGKLPPLTLDLGGREEDARHEAEFAKQQFGQIGIDLKIELNDWPTLQKKVENKQTQLYTMGWAADYPDAENFLQLFYTPNIERLTNNCNYSNPQFDKLYEEAAVMMPSPQRTELYARMIRILNEDCPVLLLSEPLSFVLVHQWMRNVKRAPFGYGNLKYLRIDIAQRVKDGGR